MLTATTDCWQTNQWPGFYKEQLIHRLKPAIMVLANVHEHKQVNSLSTAANENQQIKQRKCLQYKLQTPK